MLTKWWKSVSAGAVLGVASLALAQAAEPGQQQQQQQQDRPGQQAQAQQADPERQHLKQQQARLLVTTEIQPTDPAALLSMREDLELSQDQIDQIEQIHEEARQQARELLNADQREKTQKLQGGPQTALQLHQQVMAEMPQRMRRGQAQQAAFEPGEQRGQQAGQQRGPRMMCPVMDMAEQAQQGQQGQQQDRQSPQAEGDAQIEQERNIPASFEIEE